jgi:hypothetical protein
VPYQGYIPGFGGDNGPYGGDFTTGVAGIHPDDPGYPSGLWIDTTPTPHAGGTVMLNPPPMPSNDEPSQPFPVSTPIPGEEGDLPPVIFPPEGPPYQLWSPPDYPDEPIYMPVPPPGQTDYIPPITVPGGLPANREDAIYPSVGDVNVTPTIGYGAVDPGIFRRGPGTRDRMKRRRKSPFPRAYDPGMVYGRKTAGRAERGYRFPGPVLNAPAAPPESPPEDETDRSRERPGRDRPTIPEPEAPPMPEAPPDAPANDPSYAPRPIQQVEPVRIPDPAGVRAPFPQLPPVPQPPTVSVPTPEAPTWPKPSAATPTFPVSAPQTTIPSPVPMATSSPSARAAPITYIAPLLGLLLDAFGSVRSATPTTVANIAAPSAPAVPLPTPIATPITAPISVPGVAPGLTPSPNVGVESPPQGASCETPSQTRQRRQAKRDACEKFITVVVPKHRRRVCAAEAGRILGRKIGKKIGRAVGREVRTVLKKAGVPLARLPKRKRIPRSIEVGGGFGIELPRMPGGR